MDDQQQFLKLLSSVLKQIRLNWAWQCFQYGIAGAGGAALCILLLARIIVFPYYHQAALFSAAVALAISFIWAFRSWPDFKEAANLYNRYVPEDRVISAFSFYNKDGIVQRLQLAETVSYMKREESAVLNRKNKYPLTKWIAIGLLFLAFGFLSDLVPTKKMELSEKRETELEVVKKTEKSLKKKIAQEKDPSAKKALEELKKELAKAKSPEEALKMMDKKKKELALKELKEAEKGNELAKLADELEKAGLEKLAAAIDQKDIEKAVNELGELNKSRSSLTDSQNQALKNLTGQETELSAEQLDSLRKKLEEAMKSDEKMKQLASAQNSVTNVGKAMQKLMASNGLPPSQIAMGSSGGNQPGQNSSGKSGGKPPSGNAGNPGSQPGNQPQNGAAGGNSSGSGQGEGQENGQGSGQGSGQGNGQGNGGTGAGAGLGQGSREFLTIPEITEGKTNVETDSGGLGEGGPREQFESDGPVLKGTIRPYEQVYNDYAASYRNSLDRRKLPGGLENIVKNYFSDLNPNKE
ncbi:hypothetical protein D1B31_17110 [Neobacillus notoginsengisoli]|uniref:Uncharacterized protein n=1 Tax=Neobacillus notoginsengisoli TaxID=1578198 RepID=A0A417YQA9_9BACI|nr:proline-rich domain-containing protein [Neobacillus notoginsengisoli]RHW36436.1 hypothetical protein D1B31_17110 [Neobacillus notoginsengisoli]